MAKSDSVRWQAHISSSDGEEEERVLISDNEVDDTNLPELLDELSSSHTSHLTCYLLTVVSFSVIGGFLFGYDTGVISGALLVLDQDYHYTLTILQKELLVSITIGAAAVGAICGGSCNEYLGRKRTIMIASIIFTIGAVVMVSAPINAWGWAIILVGRFIVGLGIGLASMTVPMYLAECSPINLRGRLTVLDNMAVTGGQFVAGIIDFAFSYTRQGWRYMLGLAAIPSLIRLVAFVFLPESPRWLVGKGKTNEAKLVLRKLRGKKASETSIEKELQEIYANLQQTAKQNEKNLFIKLWIMLTHRHLLTALVVGCGLQAIQQLSGINTVMYYSPTILKMAGVNNDHLAIGLGGVIAFGNFIFTLIGVYCVEKVGRRKLALASLIGIVFSLLLLAIAFYLASTTTQTTCPTEQCSLQHCDDCVITDNCFYCLFPSNGTYGQKDTSGYCVNRKWAIINDSKQTCWIPESTLLLQTYNSSCNELTYTVPSLSPPNDTYYYGTLHSSCPNKFSWLALVALVLYIVSFSPGMGPIPWTVNAEIYPNWARSIGNSASSTTNWISNLLVSLTFLHLTRYLTRYGAFSLYVGLASGGWVFLFLLLPETRGKSLEEVDELFKGPLCPPPGIQQTKYYRLSSKKEVNNEQ